MSSSLVVTVMGEDRPGIVEQVSQTVADHGGNWLESRMLRLGGRFAGILLVACDPARSAGLAQALRQLRGLEVLIASGGQEPGQGRQVTLELVGNDRPGIVREISRVLAALGVNVEELTSWCSAAPVAGGQLFHATARLKLPGNVSPEALRTTLESLAHDLMVDLKLEDADGA